MKSNIDALLDGLLDDSQAEAFARENADADAIRSAVETQRRIDAALARLFVAPPPEPTIGRILIKARAPRLASRTKSRSFFRNQLALAAAVGLCVVAGWRLSGFFRSPLSTDPYAPQAWRSMDAVYHDTIAAGFKPAWVCKNEDEFATYFRRSTGSRLLLADASPNIHVYGLSLCNCVTPGTLDLLARVDNAEVLVFADRANRDKGGWEPATPGLHLFQRKIGEAVLYELTPLDAPKLLDLFYLDTGERHSPGNGEPSRWQKDAADAAKQSP